MNDARDGWAKGEEDCGNRVGQAGRSAWGERGIDGGLVSSS